MAGAKDKEKEKGGEGLTSNSSSSRPRRLNNRCLYTCADSPAWQTVSFQSPSSPIPSKTQSSLLFFSSHQSMQSFLSQALLSQANHFQLPWLNYFPPFLRTDMSHPPLLQEKKMKMKTKRNTAQIRTCGFTRTRSMNKTTKSCSPYLSANRLQRGH